MADLMFVGIDPAPSKPSEVVYGNSGETPRYKSLKPDALGEWLDQKRKECPALLVAWDAPISFSPRFGYSDRPVDRALRGFLSKQIKNGNIRSKAVSALPFAGCPHWAITCDVLGRPFGDHGIFEMPKSAGDLAQLRPMLIEVHPAVTVALWCLAEENGEKMGRYKPGGGLKIAEVRRNRDAIVPLLMRRTGLSVEFFSSDDRLDAAVAWAMARDFANGEAVWVGDPEMGGYVLPTEQVEHYELSTAPRKSVNSHVATT